MEKIMMLYHADPVEFIACVVIAGLCGGLLAGFAAALAPMAGQGDIVEDFLDDDA